MYAAVRLLSHVNYTWLFIASLICVLKPWVAALRWQSFLHSYTPTLSIIHCFRFYAFGTMLNIMLPIRLGDLSRTYLVAKKSKITTATILGTVACEHFLDMFVLCCLIAACFFLHVYALEYKIMLIAKVFFIIVFIGSIIIFLIQKKLLIGQVLLKKISSHAMILKNFYSGFFQFGGFRMISKALGTTICIWITQGIWIYMLLCALGIMHDYQFGLSEIITLIVIMSVVVMIPASPGYIGTFHLMVMMGLIQMGVPKSLALSYAILAHAHSMIMIILMGLYSCFTGNIKFFNTNFVNKLMSYREAYDND